MIRKVTSCSFVNITYIEAMRLCTRDFLKMSEHQVLRLLVVGRSSFHLGASRFAVESLEESPPPKPPRARTYGPNYPLKVAKSPVTAARQMGQTCKIEDLGPGRLKKN